MAFRVPTMINLMMRTVSFIYKKQKYGTETGIAETHLYPCLIIFTKVLSVLFLDVNYKVKLVKLLLVKIARSIKHNVSS